MPTFSDTRPALQAAERGREPRLAAVVLDFDGTLADTEWPEFATWRDVYRSYGQELTLDTWRLGVGTGRQAFDPIAYLTARLDPPVDAAEVLDRFHRLYAPRATDIGVLPLAAAVLRVARAEGLRTAVASNSSRRYVVGMLRRLGVQHTFDAMATGDEVAAPKPNPALYRLVVGRLGLPPQMCLAVEDSPHGVRAALDAGLPCLAVPNAITRGMRFPDEALLLDHWEGEVDATQLRAWHRTALARRAAGTAKDRGGPEGPQGVVGGSKVRKG